MDLDLDMDFVLDVSLFRVTKLWVFDSNFYCFLRLTAFVMKSFGGAKNYIFIDQTNIDQAKEWLGQQQQGNGCFASVGTLYHIDMMVRTGESCSGSFICC